MCPFVPGAAASAAKRRCASDDAVAATALTAAMRATAERREICVFISFGDWLEYTAAKRWRQTAIQFARDGKLEKPDARRVRLL